MSPELITPLVITFNEEENIARTFAKLSWARQILVVDSGSTDRTLEILRGYPQTRVLHRNFDSFANQCNFGLSAIDTPWVLSLDADYELSDAWVDEVRGLDPDNRTAGYRTRFVYRIYGRPLRGTLYPPRVVLYRRERAIYHDEGHSHRVDIDGEIRSLSGVIFHDDRKSLKRWLTSQHNYAVREVDYLIALPGRDERRSDRIRKLGWVAPILVFLYTLIFKRCLLDGWPGWYYTMQRTIFEIMFSLELLDRRLRATPAAN